MLHKVVFKNCENKWDNALPIGNGIFGAMLFYTKHKLHIPMNHYEVYYNIGENVLPKDILAASEKAAPVANVREDMFRIADGNQPKENEPFCFYRLDK